MTQKSMAVPLSATVCGLPGALSFIVKVAFLVPVTVGHSDAGWNATLMVHVPPGAVAGPVHESAVMGKSPDVAPLSFTDTDDTVSAPANDPLLLFVTTTGTGAPAVPASWLPKPTLGGTEIDASVAAPDNATVGGLPPPTFNVAERDPGVDPLAGLNVTLIWQLLPAARLGAQEFTAANSDAFAPETLTGPTPAGAEPVFETLTACAALLVPSL